LLNDENQQPVEPIKITAVPVLKKKAVAAVAGR